MIRIKRLSEYTEMTESANQGMVRIKRINEMAIKRSVFADYDEIEAFDNEHIKVMKDGLYNIMDNDGKLLSDVWFNKVKKNRGGGFDVEYTDNNNQTHSGQYMDLPELKKNIDISNLVKHTDILDYIDFSDIILIEPYILKRQGMKRGIKIIASVTYMGKNLLLGADGKLYNQDGILYEDVQFAISQVDIKRLTKRMDELCAKLDPAFSPRRKGDNLIQTFLDTHICVFAFGFNTNASDVNYAFNTGAAKSILPTSATPWGKKSINSIKVRFVPVPSIDARLRDVLVNKFNYNTYKYEKWLIEDWDGLTTTKEYLPTELDEMYIELDEIEREIDKIYK